jgi:hypothetical protein
MTVTTDAPVAASIWSADELHALADLLAAIDTTDEPVVMLDQLEALERIKSAAAAAQVLTTAAFADAAEAAEDLPTDGRRRPRRALSIGAEVALAARTPPPGRAAGPAVPPAPRRPPGGARRSGSR